jgi:hypothetical protein
MTRANRTSCGPSAAAASRTRTAIGAKDLADDAGIEGALIGEVVIDHRLVDARASGNAVDGGGGETERPELVGGRGEDPGAGVWGAGRRRAIIN